MTDIQTYFNMSIEQYEMQLKYVFEQDIENDFILNTCLTRTLSLCYGYISPSLRCTY